MEEYIEKLQKCLLFNGIESSQILLMLKCFDAEIREYKKNQSVFKEGTKINKSGLVLKGALQLVQYDYFGNRSIVSRIEENQIFGEAYSLCKSALPVNVEAEEDSLILLMNANKIAMPCTKLCQNHITLINNLLVILAKRNVQLNQKIECLSKRTTREKILDYLTLEEIKNESKEFVIPYDRQALADYLCVDRSALSHEIGKLIKEGIIESKKNYFKLK